MLTSLSKAEVASDHWGELFTPQGAVQHTEQGQVPNGIPLELG